MRVEHRAEEKEKANGLANGDGLSMLTNGEHSGDLFADLLPDDRPVPATSFPESGNPSWKNAIIAKADYAQVDERLKAELRFIGFLGQEDDPDFDSHFDDEVAQRLRFLQTELKKLMILNGARKARLHQIADEHMGWQEFAHIKDDLDNQVVTAFSKRNRTLGKGKKNAKRPGGAAGGGSHQPGGTGSGAGVSRPGIGDAARTIMDRRKRWNDTVSPIFSEDVVKVRGPEDRVFRGEDMVPFLVAEKDRLEEEAE
jgi:transcriptional adapter 3